MKKVVGLVLFGLLTAGMGWAWGAQGTSARRWQYLDVSYGFSFEAPRFPKPAAGQSAVPIVLSGPVGRNGASNLSVAVQPAAISRREYLDLSRRQFQQAGLKLRSEHEVTVSGREALRLEYEGKVNGREFRFLALAVLEKDRVFLLTCAAPLAEFKAMESEFIACLDSVRFP